MSQPSIDEIFNEEVRRRIEESIRNAEQGTSGEIRVHLEEFCAEDPLDHAAFIFSKLDMHRTALRNGVLIYLSVADHKLAIIGDAGIHSFAGPDFWKDVTEKMIAFFRNDQLAEGIIEGVRLAGEKLKYHFPLIPGDQNELANQVTIGYRKNRKTTFISKFRKK